MAASPIWLIYLLIFCGGFLALQAFIGAGRQAAVKVKSANDRLRRMESDDSQAAVVAKIRKSRSLTKTGDLQGAITWLNQLVLQSGLPLGAKSIYYILPAASVISCVMLGVVKGTILWGAIGAVAGLGSADSNLKLFR